MVVALWYKKYKKKKKKMRNPGYSQSAENSENISVML